jgi:hypothetical protein
MGLLNNVGEAFQSIEETPGKVIENIMAPTTPAAVVVWVTAAVLGVYVLNFTLPGSATKKLNWNHLKESLALASNSALTLLPALSALVIPDSNPVMYLSVGFALYFIGIGFQCIPKQTCRSSGGAVASCTKEEKAWWNLGQGLQTAGASAVVGAALIYLQNKVAGTM